MINDEFTLLPVSRQRKAQLRWQKAGLCCLCGHARVNASHCRKHAKASAERSRVRYRALHPECKHYVKLVPQKVAYLFLLYKQGLSVNKIADKTLLSLRVIRKHLKEQAALSRHNKRRLESEPASSTETKDGG